MDPKENSYLNNDSQEDRADSRQMVDSPFPKLHAKLEHSTVPYSSITPIEEEDSSTSLSRNLTPIRHFETQQEQPKGLNTPITSFSHLKNQDQSLQNYQDLLSKSAQRVIIYENGDQELDITWTELKKKLLDRINEKVNSSTPTHISMNLEKLTMSQGRNMLRRSKRLAEIKSKTSEKRKVPDIVKKNYKKVKK